uniref:MYND-type domain-containing protein n=1 Tax=Anopheles christyi TaxID=43041 RepID=A0A182JXZ3_9DIPT
MACYIKQGVHTADVLSLRNEMWETTIKHKLEQAGKKNAHEIISFLIKEIGYYVRANPYRERFNLHRDVKDDDKAAKFRAKGNELFHPKNYIEATFYYNESIAHSNKGSEARAIAYANRAAVCILLGRYDDCLENIRLARESNYPASMMMKLNVREMTAKSMQTSAQAARRLHNDLQEEEAHEHQIKLSFPAHPKVPQIVKDLKLCQNQPYGRHVVAGRALKAGHVVMIEKPYATVSSEHMKRVRCANCHNEAPFLLLPCEQCTVAMYCSGKCLKAAWQQYHRYECPILRAIWQFGTEHLAMTVRITAIAFATFDHDLEAIRQHLSRLDVSKVNAYEMDWNTASPKDIYETVYVLASQIKRRPKDLALQILVATITHDLLMKRTDMGKAYKADPILQMLLFKLIFRHLLGTMLNHHFLLFMDYQPGQQIQKSEEYAMACFPLLSMLNHSCAPNVKRITLRDGRCALIVTRPIAKGAQLFDHYDLGLYKKSEAKQSLQVLRTCLNEMGHDYPSCLTTDSFAMDLKLVKSSNVYDLFDKLWQCKIKACLENASNSTESAAPKAIECFITTIVNLVREIPIRELLNLFPDVKCRETALALRAKGTEMYHPRVRNYMEAFKFFNASIAHTEMNSVDRGIAYANRSIVCMEMHLYKACLENVRLARQSNYPTRFLPKLAAREAHALEALQRAKKISAKQLKNGHCATERSKLVWKEPNKLLDADKVNQRSKKLRPDMYGLSVVEYENLYSRCNYCESRRLCTFIPCEGCTLAMFCSVKCLTEAYQSYHRYECGLVRDLWRIGGMKVVAAFRKIATEIAALKDVPSSIEYLDLLVTLNMCHGVNGSESCGIADLSAPRAVHPVEPTKKHRELSFLIFLTTIVHQLVVERTELGLFCIEHHGMSQMLFDLILYYLNTFTVY